MRILLFISAMLLCLMLQGQEYPQSVVVSEPQLKTEGPIPNSHLYIPNGSTPMKYIRVNFHFMLRSQGDPGYPGNFTSTHDGHGNTAYTGYDFVKRYIDMANQHLADNRKMTLPPNNGIPNIETRYRYVLDGVYFHEDNRYYCQNNPPPFDYWRNRNRAINVFLNCPVGGGTSHATYSQSRFVVTIYKWGRYNDYLADPRIGDAMWINGLGLNHEIGHNLSLRHTVMTHNGTCSWDWDDYCSDTPTRSEIMSNFNFDPCCKWATWNATTCSNNLMDYGHANMALTPQQLGRVHWTLEHEMKEYQTCFLDQDNLTICALGFPQVLYMARTIVVGGSGCNNQPVILGGRQIAHLIASQSVTLNAGFGVQLGAEFTIDMVTPCN